MGLTPYQFDGEGICVVLVFCLVLDLDSSMIFGGAADTRCNCIMVVLCCSTEVVRGPLVCMWSGYGHMFEHVSDTIARILVPL